MLLYRLNFDVFGWLFGRYWRLSIRGHVDEIPARGPAIVTANHQSFGDPWFISAVFPRHVRYLITDNWFYKNRIWETVFRSYNGIPLDSENPNATIDTVCACLEAGDVVGIFPEGRISHDGKLQAFKSGTARIASRTGAPVIPLGIRGSFESLPRTTRIPRPRRITIHVGRPVTYEEITGRVRPCKPGHLEFIEHLHRETLRLAGQDETAAAEARPSSASGLQPAIQRSSED